MDNESLGRHFREAHLAGLRQLGRQQKLRLVERAAFEQVLSYVPLQD